MEFRIEIDPPVEGKPSPIGAPIDLSTLDFGRIHRKSTRSYVLRFVIAGEVFYYYSCDISTILNDLILERDNIQSRKYHEVKLGGYTVLIATIFDDKVQFINPVGRGDKIGPYIVGCAPISQILDELDEHLRVVYGTISNL